MSHDPSSAAELQDVAARVIAATEYFKSAGHLPGWARAEMQSRADRDEAASERRSPRLAGRDPQALTGGRA